jgi:undecaprenyl-diphosphatase
LAAVVVFFRQEIARMIAAIPHALSNPIGLITGRVAKPTERDADARLGLLIVIATLPGLVLGLLFEERIDDFFHTESASDRAIAVIATMMIVVAFVMFAAEKVGTRTRSMTGLKWVDALIIGGAQAVALIPGTSRSGATISAGLFRGLKRGDAARFSFLAGMPLVLGVGLKSMIDVIREGMSGHEVALFLSGGVSSAIVGFLTIWGLLRFLERQSTLVFIVYRIAFGLLLFGILIFE